MKKVICVFGTRPEAIKMAPVVKALQARTDLECKVCVTGQHREMLDKVTALFEIVPDYDLNVMKPNQTLEDVTAAVAIGAGKVFSAEKPDLVLVHGDVTTGFSAALAAFYQKIPVGHVEAGLRTGDIYAPYPEEMNRKLISNLTTLHFAPTEIAAANLYRENVKKESVFITGNTVIDALLEIKHKVTHDAEYVEQAKARFSYLDQNKRLILITGHRRENFDGGLERVCRVMKTIAERGDVQILYPVHLNPHVKKAAYEILSDTKDVFLIEPQDYPEFVYLMNRAYLIVTDSGGVQEEAPSLKKPVLVTRDVTERQEAADAGSVKLTGADPVRLQKEILSLLDDPQAYAKMATGANPYGDGTAAKKIAQIVSEFLNGA